MSEIVERAEGWTEAIAGKPHEAIDDLKFRNDEEFVDDVIAGTQLMPVSVKVDDLAKLKALLAQRIAYWGTRTMDKRNPLFRKDKSQ